MDCVVGTSTGALKSVTFKDSTFNNINAINGLLPKNDEITSLCWADEDETHLLTAQMDKQLKLYDITANKLSNLFTLEKCGSPVRGIHRMKCGNIVTASKFGELLVSSADGELVKEFSAGDDLVVMTPNRELENVYATGGRENALKVWDLESGKKTFIAKNVRNDSLQLRVPIWETGICFVPNSQNIVTATGLHLIRLYDPRTQRRPVKELEWLEEPLSAISLCNKEMHVVAGNTRGEMGLFDWRNSMRFVCKYKGSSGSITGIDANQSSDYISSCSMDRFVRLHDINTKKLVKKVYCKARLNCILFRQKSSMDGDQKDRLEQYEDDWKRIKNLKSEDSGESDDEDEDDSDGSNMDKHSSSSNDDEALWNDMPKIDENKKIKRKVTIEDDNENLLTQKRLKLKKSTKRKGADKNVYEVKTKKKKETRLKRKSESECDEESVSKKFVKITKQ